MNRYFVRVAVPGLGVDSMPAPDLYSARRGVARGLRMRCADGARIELHRPRGCAAWVSYAGAWWVVRGVA